VSPFGRCHAANRSPSLRRLDAAADAASARNTSIARREDVALRCAVAWLARCAVTAGGGVVLAPCAVVAGGVWLVRCAATAGGVSLAPRAVTVAGGGVVLPVGGLMAASAVAGSGESASAKLTSGQATRKRGTIRAS